MKDYGRLLYEKIIIKYYAITNKTFNDTLNIKSHLTINERIQLKRLSRNIYIILEIGSYVGASACSFGCTLKKQGKGTIFCIDTWKNDAMSEGKRDTFSEFIKNTSLFAEYIVPIRGLSIDVLTQVKEEIDHVDLLFIDGDHSYIGVKTDWEAYKNFLKPGSIVVFHDWGWAEGVKKVIEEDVMPIVSDFDTLPNMWWGTIKSNLC